MLEAGSFRSVVWLLSNTSCHNIVLHPQTKLLRNWYDIPMLVNSPLESIDTGDLSFFLYSIYIYKAREYVFNQCIVLYCISSYYRKEKVFEKVHRFKPVICLGNLSCCYRKFI